MLADSQYQWFYWLAPILAISFILVASMLSVWATSARSSSRSTGASESSDRGCGARGPGPRSRTRIVGHRNRSTGRSRPGSRVGSPARDPIADSYLAASLAEDFASVTTQAEALVTEHTGLRVVGDARASVLDRSGWVEANVASMRRLLGPLTSKLGSEMVASPLAPIGRTVSATELGVLLGWFSQRVLGQYDLLVPDDARRDRGSGCTRVGPTATRSTTSAPTSWRSRSASRSDRATSGSGSRSTRSPTGRSSSASRGCATTSSVWSSARSAASTPTPASSSARSLRAADELRQGRNPLDDGGIVALLATPGAPRRRSRRSRR